MFGLMPSNRCVTIMQLLIKTDRLVVLLLYIFIW